MRLGYHHDHYTEGLGMQCLKVLGVCLLVVGNVVLYGGKKPEKVHR